MSFTESDSTAAKVRGMCDYVLKRVHQENEHGRFYLSLDMENPAKAMHRLHAPQEVSTEACCAWLDAYLAKYADGFLIPG